MITLDKIVITAKNIFIIVVFSRYLFKIDLSLAISLTKSVLKPKSRKILEIEANESPNERMPYPSTPKYLAAYIIYKKPNT